MSAEGSSVKLGHKLGYHPKDRADLECVVNYVYREGAVQGRPVPTMGKIWCGETPEERELYLSTRITPRPNGQCHVARRSVISTHGTATSFLAAFRTAGRQRGAGSLSRTPPSSLSSPRRSRSGLDYECFPRRTVYPLPSER